MKLLDSIDIIDGQNKRRIGLYEGDLAKIPPEHRADILVVSAFPDNYAEVPGTLVGELANRAGLSIGMLSANKAIDLRSTSAFWISHPLGITNQKLNIGQIACFESVLGSPPEIVGDFFRGLFPFLDDRKSPVVAMSVLASGNEGWPGDTMLRAILEAATHWLARGLPIRELMIVEFRARKAAALATVFADFRQKLNVTALSPTETAAYDVFLSFSSKDRDAADCARQVLEGRRDVKKVFDFRLPIDKEKSWQNKLDNAIASCKDIVPILSPAYFASPECQEELAQARLRNKHSVRRLLFPVYWRDLGLGQELGLWLQAMSYYDCRESNVQSLTTTMQSLPLS